MFVNLYSFDPLCWIVQNSKQNVTLMFFSFTRQLKEGLNLNLVIEKFDLTLHFDIKTPKRASRDPGAPLEKWLISPFGTAW